jgi:hypothetical protein
MTAREGREPSLSEDRVSQYWDHAPDTLGLAYLLRSTWRDLWELKFEDPDLLSKLHSLAHNHEMVLHFFKQYNWLLEFFDQKLSRIPKFSKLEPLVGFAGKMPIHIEPFTDKQTVILQSAGKKSTPGPEGSLVTKVAEEKAPE